MTIPELVLSLGILQESMKEDDEQGDMGISISSKGSGEVHFNKGKEPVFKFKNLRQLGIYLEQTHGG